MSIRLQNIEMQLSEIEMLQSMFPDTGEVMLDDEFLFIETKKCIEDSGEDPSRPLKLDLKLKLNDVDVTLDVEFIMGLNYPSEEQIGALVRCQNMNKSQYKEINEELKKLIDELGIGDLCIFQIIEWLNENAQNFINVDSHPSKDIENVPTCDGPQYFSRLWIYSHHIYSKTKRKNILEWSKELELTGFSMPGKPGVVCVEGPENNCEEFWQRVKRLNWKHIEVRHREEKLSNSNRQYSNMSEVSFEVHGNRGNHMNMGSLFQFLNNHSCGEVFVHLFGVEGRLPEKMKRQTWKRLSLAHKEGGKLAAQSSSYSVSFQKKFPESVTEKDFGVHGGRDYHMDLGQFAAFLDKHDCHDIFSMLFGVEGKSKADVS